MAVPFDGTFLIDGPIAQINDGHQFDRTDEEYQKEIEALQNGPRIDLETHHEDGKQVQIFVSQYSLSTMILAHHAKGLMSIS